MNISSFSKTYDKRKVLDFPGMEFHNGNVYAVIGANGSGKSTFAKILSGVLPDDKKQRHLSNYAVGYMPQKNYAFRMSVKDNLLLNGTSETRAIQLMDGLQLRHLEEKRANTLSGGETARMALARMMMKSYDVLILDEPTAAMDMETTILAEQVIARYAKETNCILILITHSLQQARRIADEVLFFQNGNLVEYGGKEELLYQPRTEELKRFLDFYGIV